jgi:hypothetical protein
MSAENVEADMASRALDENSGSVERAVAQLPEETNTRRSNLQIETRGASRRRGQEKEDSSTAKPDVLHRSTDLLYSPSSELQAPRNPANKNDTGEQVRNLY